MSTYGGRILRIGVASIALFVVAHPVYADRVDDTVFENIVQQEVEKDSSVQELNGDIQAKADQVRSIEERLNTYKDNLEKKQQERATLQNEIEKIQDQIAAASDEVGKNRVEIDILNLEVQVLEKQVIAAETDIERGKKLLADLIEQLYLRDQQSPLEIALTHDTLSEYYSEAEYTQRIQESMQETIDVVQQKRQDLDSKKTEMVQKKSDITKETAELQLQQEQLEGQETYKDQILSQTKQSEEEFQKLVAQAKADQASLEGQIAALQGNAQEKILRIRTEIQSRLNDGDTSNDTLTNEEKDILEGSTTMQWPVPSRMVTCGFHCPGYPFQNVIGPHSGMDMRAAMGTPVQAAASGYVARVVFDPSSSRLAWVMIEHADGLASLYLHMSGINVRADQFVAKGQVIGRSGGMPGTPGAGLSTAPHLHFEVRLNGIATDPAKYLP